MSNVEPGSEDEVQLDIAEVTEDIDNVNKIDVNSMVPFILGTWTSIAESLTYCRLIATFLFLIEGKVNF